MKHSLTVFNSPQTVQMADHTDQRHAQLSKVSYRVSFSLAEIMDLLSTFCQHSVACTMEFIIISQSGVMWG